MDVTNHGLVLLQQLNIQREFGFLCDCTVAVGDIHFKAHRAVLAAFSNYFKMIFIHQSSDCIKIQPMDIQPDIFSYLLHLMYTGKGPKQPVDPSRLEEGIRFLHAYNLVQDPGHSAGFTSHHELLPLQSPNLYGIQISGSHKLSVGSPPSGGLRDLQPPTLRNGSEPLAVLSPGEQRYPRGPDPGTPEEHSPAPGPALAPRGLHASGLNLKRGKSHKLYSCHYCGERFSTRSSLRDHLYSHASGPQGESKTPLPSEELERIEAVDISQELGDGSITDETLITEPETPDTGSQHPPARKRKISCLLCGHSSELDLSSAPQASEEVPVGSSRKGQKLAVTQVSAGEMESAFREVFAQYGRPHAHCHYKCRQINCERVQLSYKRGDKFVHKWLSNKDLTYCERTGIYWLLYQEGQGMFCFLCRKHDTQNKQNKTKVFNGTPAVRYKKSALQVHAESQQHMAAVQAELEARASGQQLVERDKEAEETGMLFVLFLAAYWLAREDIPSSKLLSLLRLMSEAGLRGLTHFRRSETLREIFLSLGNVIREQVVGGVRRAGCYGLLSEQVSGGDLLSSVRYVDPHSAEVRTGFLCVEGPGGRAGASQAEGLVELIRDRLRSLELPEDRMASLVTDGSEVMTGEKVGVAARLRELNPSLIAVHCLGQGLGLAGAPSCPHCRYLITVEGSLQQLWGLLETSPGLCAAYLRGQLEAKGMAAPTSGRITRALLRRLARACHHRRLNLEASVDAACRDYLCLVRILREAEVGSATASGLLAQLDTVRFLGALSVLREICPILSGLSKVFRKGTVNFFTVEPSVKYAVYRLNEVTGSKAPLARVREELQPGGRLEGAGLSWGEVEEAELGALLDAYVKAVKSNLQRRFSASLPLLSAFSIFNPLLVPAPESPDFGEYGMSEIRTLAQHFYREPAAGDGSPVKAKAQAGQLVEEWAKLRFDLFSWKNNVPEAVLTDTSTTVTEWCLKRLFSLKSELQQAYPSLLPLAEVSLSMPVTNAWSDRGCSALCRLESSLHGRPKPDLLNSLMHISLNGPDFGSAECAQVVQRAVNAFLQQRRGRLGAGGGPGDRTGSGCGAEEGAELSLPEAGEAGGTPEQDWELELEETGSSLHLHTDNDSDSEESVCD